MECGELPDADIFGRVNPMNDPNNSAKLPEGAARPFDRCAWLALLTLIVATMVLYWPVLNDNYIGLDDPEYAGQNPMVQAGLTPQGILWAFTTPVVSNWHPLTMISLMLDCDLWGTGPWGHLFDNVVLHALNTGLVFLFLRQITGAYWRSLLVAAWFGWHPLHVESVAWIAERKDVLSTFFWLLALGCYGFYAQGTSTAVLKPKHFYILSLVLTAFGLMSKAMLVTMPCVLLLLDFWPLNRFQSGRLIPRLWEKMPFFILVAVFSVLTVIVQRQNGAMNASTNFLMEIQNTPFSYCRYLYKTFWPSNLAVFYPYPISGYWPLEYVAGSLLALILITCWVWNSCQKYPYLLTGWFWFLGTLIPVIGLIQVGNQSLADRYMYVPVIGLFIMLAWGGHALAGSLRIPRGIPFSVSVATLLLCVAATRHELGYWRDTFSLFGRALAVTKDNFLAHQVLGLAHANLGTKEDQQSHYEEAAGHFRRAIEIKPDFYEARYNYGLLLANQGRFDEAITNYRAAIARYREATALHPVFASVYNNLGFALAQEKRDAEAIQSFHEALRLVPNLSEAHHNLGLALFNVGRFPEAVDELSEAARLNPGYQGDLNLATSLMMLNNEAWTLATSPDPAARNGQRAVELGEQACKTSGYQQPMFMGTLAAAYAEAGRFDDAVQTANKACELGAALGDTNLVQRNQELIRRYKTHQAYHQAPAQTNAAGRETQN